MSLGERSPAEIRLDFANKLLRRAVGWAAVAEALERQQVGARPTDTPTTLFPAQNLLPTLPDPSFLKPPFALLLRTPSCLAVQSPAIAGMAGVAFCWPLWVRF